MAHPKRLTPLRAIKQYCRYECSANDLISWRECTFEKCPLFPHRLGKRVERSKERFFVKKTTTFKDKTQEKQLSVGEDKSGN